MVYIAYVVSMSGATRLHEEGPFSATDYIFVSISGLLTKKFVNLIKQAEDGVLDLNKAADTLHVGT